MQSHDTDRDWEHFGRTEPYWAVSTKEQFRQENLDSRSIAEFFAGGEKHVNWVSETVRRRLDGGFAPRTALDFGCGVGRLTLPLARRCEFVVGVDVSESMLREARAQAAGQGLANVRFVRGDDDLSAIRDRSDFIISHIVFQHIPCDRGQRLLRRLVDLLADGGVGAIHLTYSKAAFDGEPFDAWPASAPAYSGRPLVELRKSWSAFVWGLRRRFRDRRRKRGGSDGIRMQMNPYTLNPLLHVLQRAGVRRMHVEFTDHGGDYGVILFFKKSADEGYFAWPTPRE